MAPSEAEAESDNRYVVGIDLGTTNSAVMFVDKLAARPKITAFAIPQLVAPGVIEPREGLPSFHYEPATGETTPGALRLPWSAAEPGYSVGTYARDQGALVPARLIASAKSWLCHAGVDRTAPLLPWQGASDVTRLSPVQVSGRYLQQIREAWDHRFPKLPLRAQDVVLTLPASFDEVARELTVQAAAVAGLPRVVLIEEPQAAFYAWIETHTRDWQQRVAVGQNILVCDIGGGTSDFTLIRVRQQEGGQVQFHRLAVGEHLILGGDNLDLALARHLEQRLTKGGRLDPRPWAMLVHQSRQVKETLLGDDAPEKLTVTLPGSGARLIGGGQRIEVTREEVRQVLLDGFFPLVSLDDQPQRRRSGFQEFGLPYAPDPAVTRYLAAFLTAHRNVAAREEQEGGTRDPVRPDLVLFNGGAFLSRAVRDRVVAVLNSWFQPLAPDWKLQILENRRLDLAVAHGAAYYGLVRLGRGVRIAAGLARTYYVGFEGEPPQAVCLLPAGIEAGQQIDLDQHPFELLVSQPVAFPLYVSSTRLMDHPGDIVPFDRDQMTPLPPLKTVLSTSRKQAADRISVTLHARLTEIGTLDLWISEREGKRSWKLQFDVRSATQTDRTAHESLAEQEGVVDETVWQACLAEITATFGPEAPEKPDSLVKRLAAVIGLQRHDWPTTLLRRLWEGLIEHEAGRRRSPQHEARWLNLLGYALRPGYGLAADDWRVAETRRILQGKLVHSAAACLTEWWILFRRIGAGLTAGQQQALADPLIASLRLSHRQMESGKGRGGDFNPAAPETAEIWRLLGSLERLSVETKFELGKMICRWLPRPRLAGNRPTLIWALGRLGARIPLYGPLNTVVSGNDVVAWIETLLELPGEDRGKPLALMQLARRTGDQFRDIPDAVRQRVLTALQSTGAPAHYGDLVRDVGVLDEAEQGLVFGETLPHGLRLSAQT